MRYCLVALLLMGISVSANAQKAKVRTVDVVAKEKGLTVLKTVSADVDGDGVNETVAAVMKATFIHVAIFEETADNTTLSHVFPSSGGTELKSIETQNLVPPDNSAEIILETYSENPDEKIKRLRIYTTYRKPREIFTTAIFRSKDKNRRDAWERLSGVVEYGDARPGWYFDDDNADGTKEVIVRRDPQLLKIPREGDDPANALTGVRELVYEYIGPNDAATFVERTEKRFTDFLPAYEIESVSGSSVFVPKSELADLEADALAAALYAATDDVSTEKIPDVKVDFTPYFARAADKNLDTAWIEGDEKGTGKDESIEIKLHEAKPIRMVRIVSGCVANKKTFKLHNVPTKFEIRFDNGERAIVDLTSPKKTERPVHGAMAVPLKGRDVGEQVLIFFPGDHTSERVTLKILDVKKQGRANQACVSEVSVH